MSPNLITMKLLYLYFLLVLAFLVHELSAQPLYTTLVAPLLKHTATSSLYSVTLNSVENYLIDLDSPFSLYRCDDEFPDGFVSCSSDECLEARSYISSFCSPTNKVINRKCVPCPSCSDNRFLSCEDFCDRCGVTSVNLVTQSCDLSQLTHRDIIIDWTNGRNPAGKIYFNSVYATCAPSSLFQSIPNSTIGIASLSRSQLSLFSGFNLPGMANKFAICLPSSSGGRGVSFFGDGPYYILPENKDLKSLLSYTPLLNNTNSPVGYYIGLDGIFISRNALPISLSNISVKLSTIVPYTTLRSDIYKHFIRMFLKGVKGIPQVKAVSPFSLCLNTSTIGFNRVGLRVPQINFHLGNGSIWTIYGPNSMKKVGNNVACLGFIDGGETAQEGVVIGSFQMENNLLFFDLENSMFGFSSTLLLERTTCGNFNFTTVNWYPPRP